MFISISSGNWDQQIEESHLWAEWQTKVGVSYVPGTVHMVHSPSHTYIVHDLISFPQSYCQGVVLLSFQRWAHRHSDNVFTSLRSHNQFTSWGTIQSQGYSQKPLRPCFSSCLLVSQPSGSCCARIEGHSQWHWMSEEQKYSLKISAEKELTGGQDSSQVAAIKKEVDEILEWLVEYTPRRALLSLKYQNLIQQKWAN